MILKFKSNGCWGFLDNITDASILSDAARMDANIKEKAAVSCVRAGVRHVYRFDDEVYLLNDTGDTIQKIIGK